jgi:hypothetical protein
MNYKKLTNGFVRSRVKDSRRISDTDYETKTRILVEMADEFQDEIMEFVPTLNAKDVKSFAGWLWLRATPKVTNFIKSTFPREYFTKNVIYETGTGWYCIKYGNFWSDDNPYKETDFTKICKGEISDSRRINDMAMKNEEGYNRYIANKNEKKRASNEKRADKNAIIEKINEKVKFLNSQYGEEMFNDIDTFEGYENGAEELIYKFERKQNYGGWVSKDMAYRSGIKIFGDEAHGNNYVNIVFVKNEDKESLPLLTDIYILLRTKDKWYKASSEGIESFVNDIYDTDIVNGVIQDFESFKLNTENFVASFNTFVNQVGDSRRIQTINRRRVKDSFYDTVTSALPKYVREQDWLTPEQLTEYFMTAIQDGCRKPNGDYNDNAYRNILVTVYNFIEMDSRK